MAINQHMDQPLSLIGFGEAGCSFAKAAGWRELAQTYDIKLNGANRGTMLTKMQDAGVSPRNDTEDALHRTSVVLSLVTASASFDVSTSAQEFLSSGTLYFDLNSVAPGTKQKSAAQIEAVGGRYVDVAIMSPVNPVLMDVPLLVSGPHENVAIAKLNEIGFSNVRAVGQDVGRASTIKMLRSVMYKGVEALTAECLLACKKAGVTDDVLSSFGNDWSEQADYRLDRMLVHGLRRSSEMVEAVKTLEALDVEPLLTRGTVERQMLLGEMKLDPVPNGLEAKLEAMYDHDN